MKGRIMWNEAELKSPTPRTGAEDTQQDDARYAHPLLPRRSEGIRNTSAIHQATGSPKQTPVQVRAGTSQRLTPQRAIISITPLSIKMFVRCTYRTKPCFHPITYTSQRTIMQQMGDVTPIA